MVYRLYGGPADGMVLQLPDDPSGRSLWLDQCGTAHRAEYVPGPAGGGGRVATYRPLLAPSL
jgi:hypothetical protein